jgi:hypothetical protein
MSDQTMMAAILKGKLASKAVEYANTEGTPLAGASITGSPSCGMYRVEVFSVNGTLYWLRATAPDGKVRQQPVAASGTNDKIVPGVELTMHSSLNVGECAYVNVYTYIELLADTTGVLGVREWGDKSPINETYFWNDGNGRDVGDGETTEMTTARSVPKRYQNQISIAVKADIPTDGDLEVYIKQGPASDKIATEEYMIGQFAKGLGSNKIKTFEATIMQTHYVIGFRNKSGTGGDDAHVDWVYIIEP